MSEREKVAVLGGGAAALTAALALTDENNRDRYDVTVYQMGWRLGGKGASGRNADHGQRIEEHGIHVWFGFYDNAFRLLSACYDEIAAIPGQRPWSLPKCIGGSAPPDDNGAFYPHDDYFLHELHKGAWQRWHVQAPRNDRTPGDGRPLPPELSFGFRKLREMLVSVAKLREQGILAPAASPLESATTVSVPEDDDEDEDAGKFAEAIRRRHPGAAPPGDDEAATALRPEHYLEGALDALCDPKLDDEMLGPEEGLNPLDQERRFKWRVRFLAWSLRRARQLLKRWLKIDETEPLRRIFRTVDTSAAITTGLYKDVLAHGLTSFDHLDDVDLRDWLKKHGAAEGDPDLLAHNPTIRFVYNSAFSFVEGDHEQPSIAAGAALRGILRLFLTYKGAFAYRMSSGMGDVVFSPIYEVLRRRGVKFRFFHRVDRLEVADGPEGPRIETIHVRQQVNLRDESREYYPFVWVKNFPAWPDRPRYEQIADGTALATRVASGLNLEDPDARWLADEPEVTLRAGHEFDKVVLGIPVAALPKLTSALATHPKAGPAWKRMLEEVKTTPTQAFQVWFRGTLRDLGWDHAPPVAGTYIDPIDTYIDMTPALQMEERRAEDVGTLSYFCGVMKTVDKETAGDSRHRATQNAIRHLQEAGSEFFPKLGSGDGFDWTLLSGAVTTAEATPESRFASQYARANVLPSERYTLGLPGTTAARLGADESGFGNLFLAGDWTRNPINLGCVEATVMSGLQAARAAGAKGVEITGEHDAYLWQSLGRGSGPAGVLEGMNGGEVRPSAAPMTPPMVWGSTSIGELQVALDEHQLLVAEGLCAALVEHLTSADEEIPPGDCEKVLKALRGRRQFALIEQVGDALERRGVQVAALQILHAQALIERKSIGRALGILRAIADDPKARAEDRAEAQGLIGRARKQEYVDARGPRTRLLAQKLDEAVRIYRQAYEDDKDAHTWHGINLVALLDLAGRDKLSLPSAAGLVRDDLAEEVIATIDKLPFGKVQAWDYATQAEAQVALGKLDDALRGLRHYVVKANAFELASTLRQLQEIWKVEDSGSKGRALTTLLKAHLLQAEGGRIDLGEQQLQRAVDDAQGLQKILGSERPVVLDWYRKGLDRCRLIARVSGLEGTFVGTGFLVRAGDFLGNTPDPDELMLLTNAHVLGNHPGAARAAEARVSFEYPHEGLTEKEYKIRTIVRTSGKDELDYALAALRPAIRGVPPYPLTLVRPPRPSPGELSRDRLYVIGHPQGAPLSLSLYDNRLLDLDERVIHYRTPTEPGSSGSPVLNAGWELLALHHAGSQLKARLHGPGFYEANEGIFIDQILVHSHR